MTPAERILSLTIPAFRMRPRMAVEPTDPPGDHTLMIAVRGGDLDCFGELFERHHGPLYGYLYRLTGDRTASEDLAQIVFQRMLKYRHTYRDDGSFTAWMYHVARRCAADHFRRSAGAPANLDSSHIEEIADDVPDAGDRAEAQDDRALLKMALDRLDRDDRDVLLLSRIRNLPFAEVALILECSVGAAKVRAHRALRELRDVFFDLQRKESKP